MQYALYLWILINFLAFVQSGIKVKSNIKECDFIYYWGFPIGAFVWEDMLVFSGFQILMTIVTLFVADFRYWILMFLVFWIVRSSGEVLYMFLEQFIEPKHHPHFISDHFKVIRKIFGEISDQKCFILMQVFLQIILVLSLSGLIIFIMNWNLIGFLPI